MRVRTIRFTTAATASSRYAVSCLPYPAGTAATREADEREGRNGKEGQERYGKEGQERNGKEGTGRSGMGGIQNDSPLDGASAMAWGDCCLHALLIPDLAGEAGATVVSAAAEVAAAWWEK